jgi:hypothetical protein
MKIKSLIAGLLLSAVAANASITISGTSIFSADLNGFTTGVYLASNSGAFDESIVYYNLVVDISLTAGNAIGDYTILGTGAVNPAGTGSALVSGVTYNLGGNVATGNEIGVLVFENSTASTVAGDKYQIYTNDWVVAADGSNLSLTGTGAPFQGAAVGSGIIMPEPSSYALLGGLLALSCVMLRRRA